MPPLSNSTSGAATPVADAAAAHQELLDSLDLALKTKPFRNPAWRPSQRRNKNIKQIISDAQRKEAALNSLLPTQENSGTSTPNTHLSTTKLSTPRHSSNAPATSVSGTSTPVTSNSDPISTLAGSTSMRISQAAHNLSTMVLERNLQASTANSGAVSIGAPKPISATWTNIESAPSLHPASQKHYCDITGLPALYTDPKSRLRYHNRELFDVIRDLPPGVAESYLETRAAHVVLK